MFQHREHCAAMNDDVGQPLGVALEKLLSTMLTVIADSGSTGRLASPSLNANPDPNPNPNLNPNPNPNPHPNPNPNPNPTPTPKQARHAALPREDQRVL